jgi:hypothetical protein
VTQRLIASVCSLALSGFAVSAEAKCARRIIYLSGTIAGAADSSDRIVVTMDPPGFAEQTPIAIREGAFEGIALFDSSNGTRSRRGKDDCTRVPATVTVSLVRGGQLRATRRLDPRRDFHRVQADYRLRQPIVLAVPGSDVTAQPWVLSEPQNNEMQLTSARGRVVARKGGCARAAHSRGRARS